MATSTGVWGIDIGHCALKALNCRLADDGQTLVADAFDHIEYPKLLTQPDADPEPLIRDALQQFLANNDVRGSKVGISVSGQSGLARFIKLPPVEAKKIPDIVKYEAKQQIPFPLEDVVWDYQSLSGGLQPDGVAVETEVGLFAMKRDQVFRALRPFRDAGVELDLVQLTPIAIFNAVTHGVLDLPTSGDYDASNPPESVVVISMGTDTTDLVVTNGFKIWQRSIPIGGSHFTKQLMKEMKLTFAKAEHLKRNARDAEDPKAVFQAMRPVFNVMVQELQRSIGFFRSIDREAKIGSGVALGNAVRLPGLQPYLEKNLELPIQKVTEYRNLTGPSVVTTPKYKDNVLSFAVCYGLCLQGLGKSRLSTNLIPRELVTARIIKRKKPWAVAAMTLLMLAFCFSYIFHWSRWRESHPSRFDSLRGQVTTLTGNSQGLFGTDTQQKQQFDDLKRYGKAVVGGADSRFLVLELFKAINVTLPVEEGRDPNEISQLSFESRPELHIEYIESEYFPNLETYVTPEVTARYEQFLSFLQRLRAPSAPATPATTAPDDTADSAEPADTSETTDSQPAATNLPSFTNVPGWVIEIRGYHFHSKDLHSQKQNYLYTTILDKLNSGKVLLPAGAGQAPTEFTMKELGIHLPILANEGRDVSVEVPDPDYKPPAGGPERRGFSSATRPNEGIKLVPAYEFTIQFVWIETPAGDRLEKRKVEADSDNRTPSSEVAKR
jgi:type IV pilus assembly protein PilM